MRKKLTTEFPEDQHLVTAALTRGWAKRRRVKVLDLATGSWTDVHYREFGSLKWFVDREHSLDAEQRWEQVENRIPALATKLRSPSARLTDDELNGIRDVVALHLVRSWQMVGSWRRSQERVAEQHSLADFINSPKYAAAALHHFTGLHAAGPDGLQRGSQLLAAHFDEALHRGGGFFTEQLIEKYETVRVMLRHRPIWFGFAPGGDLLLGDAPALTTNRDMSRVGILADVPIGEAAAIVMPFTPWSLVVLAGGESGELPPDAIVRFNLLQAAAAQHGVVARPGASHELFISHYREAHANRSFRWPLEPPGSA